MHDDMKTEVLRVSRLAYGETFELFVGPQGSTSQLNFGDLHRNACVLRMADVSYFCQKWLLPFCPTAFDWCFSICNARA